MKTIPFVVLHLAMVASGMVFAEGDLPTKFLNQGSVANTRHNMTQHQPGGGGPDGTKMDQFRNDYEEVCVYCHTPHGANSTTPEIPLWNRTVRVTTYQTYGQLGTSTLTQPIGQPGANSIACLTCHDGQTAVDSILNMPGSGRYNKAQETAVSNAFLNTWNNRGVDATSHMSLSATGCLSCHVNNGNPDDPGITAGATDFTAFVIGTDLRNDHPVGIRFPTNNGPGTDFRTPTGTRGAITYFDSNLNGTMDKGDIRLYNTGEGAEVECASCHDPHGVPSGGPGSPFNPTFLRVSNAGSAVCLSCHVK